MTQSEAEENLEVTWAPLLETVNAMEAEMLRGYLETQGIPVQLRISKRGLSFMRGHYWAEAPFRQEDIFVPHDLIEAAAAHLAAMPEPEPVIGDDEDFVLVYAEDGEMVELDLSHGARCPACDRLGVQELISPKKFSKPLILSCLAFIVILMLFSAELSPIIGANTVFVLLSLVGVFLIFLIVGNLETDTKKWNCSQCGAEWHK